MNPAPDATTSAGNGGGFGPQQAAALLGQTTQQARRTFQPSPPWLLMAARAGWRSCVTGLAVAAVGGSAHDGMP